jgi:hypothetical protein
MDNAHAVLSLAKFHLSFMPPHAKALFLGLEARTMVMLDSLDYLIKETLIPRRD